MFLTPWIFLEKHFESSHLCHCDSQTWTYCWKCQFLKFKILVMWFGESVSSHRTCIFRNILSEGKPGCLHAALRNNSPILFARACFSSPHSCLSVLMISDLPSLLWSSRTYALNDLPSARLLWLSYTFGSGHVWQKKLILQDKVLCFLPCHIDKTENRKKWKVTRFLGRWFFSPASCPHS